jgi:hypothetical protein
VLDRGTRRILFSRFPYSIVFCEKPDAIEVIAVAHGGGVPDIGGVACNDGEPDVEVDRTEAGEVVVTLKGLEVDDPNTGDVRPSSTNEIACWFIDTEYNEESFFVRHAYFTGGDEPYDKLKRALRADIDEGAWSTLYKTTSQAFPAPKTGKIAVKVINHHGDEVFGKAVCCLCHY